MQKGERLTDCGGANPQDEFGVPVGTHMELLLSDVEISVLEDVGGIHSP